MRLQQGINCRLEYFPLMFTFFSATLLVSMSLNLVLMHLTVFVNSFCLMHKPAGIMISDHMVQHSMLTLVSPTDMSVEYVHSAILLVY